jgi:hypothetical protein
MVIMTDEPEQPQSFLIVTFSDVGSAMFNIKFGSVTPTQLLALAGYLEFRAKNDIMQTENRQMAERLQEDEMKKIALPSKPKIVVGNK